MLGNGADHVETGSLGGAGRRLRIGTAAFGDIEADALQLFGRVEIAAPLPDGDGDIDAVGLRPRPTDPKGSKPFPKSSGASSAMPVDCCPHYVLSTDARENAYCVGVPDGSWFPGKCQGNESRAGLPQSSRKLIATQIYINKAGISSRKFPAARGKERKCRVSRQTGPKAGKPEPLATPMEDTDIIDFEIIELFFFAYRDFVSDPDAILEKSGFGRAHHRVVHFVNRNPGMTVADLLDTLKITKQSLARVLKQLIDSGYIRQVAGPEDRRQRKLYPTKSGRELALALAEPQSRRIERAFEGASAEVREGVKAFLSGMRDRQRAD